ncbi:MAG: cob(I)yrinic acid a,c-diamide adenosyltransferase [Planctomycetales bacterium]|nr:cob(I)yrinic acid a,c-diamide adenosyltransferase [Planctomycetales bacterium]NIN09223.1 cob(I)yrinic acid a,c-diamide adenosyltransferase [Planctomycetales bacterium]NIN78323.1 cob(I)yrinic acid a,c-diamide adenosyltransferase [Planctomycetales bacterium]NIO35502.1 cob(I)yrinic acid a,c-diamide adenosyltransferase [Planctomycetales bacterium]NIO47272.1 cob(I)yrinic acid a,c-diamide adenosyltransferase [Planctomycetales bacterium]
MAKIYTKTGDDGQTGLIGGQRTWKDDPRIEAYGTVDELNAVLGTARCAGGGDPIDTVLERVQNELFVVGTQLATPSTADRPSAVGITLQHIATLEADIDRADQSLAPLRQFVLPAGSPLAAHLHLARTVCRRAERRLIRLARQETLTPETSLLIVYLNRLADLLFVLARAANAQSGHGDVPWRKGPE